MGYNVLSGSLSNIYNINASGTFSGSFGGDGTDLENVKQFVLYGETTAGTIPYYKSVTGKTNLEGDSTFTFNSNTDTLSISKLSASSGLNLAGIVAGTAHSASFLAIDSNNNIVLTSSRGGGTVTIANDGNNRITTANGSGGLVGEANLTFDGSKLSLQGGLVLKRRQISSTTTASVSDYFIGISASSNLDVRLPDASSLTSGQTFIFKDENGTAGTHTILILASGSQKIDDNSSIRLESPFAAVNVYSNGTDKYFIF